MVGRVSRTSKLTVLKIINKSILLSNGDVLADRVWTPMAAAWFSRPNRQPAHLVDNSQ